MEDKIIWGEIATKPSLRMPILSKNIKHPNEFKSYLATSENLEEVLETAKKETVALRIASELMEHMNFAVHQNYSEIIKKKTLDSLFLEKTNGWWPDLILEDAVQKFISCNLKNLDITHPAFVIGSNGLARAVVAGLVKLGVKSINISDVDEDKAQQIANDFSKMYFQTSFKFIPKDSRTLLPGVHAVVVNTLDFVEYDEFLSELYYFNFLKKGGIVIDFAEIPLETPFVRIAKDIGATTYVGYQVWAYSDLLWLQKVFKGPFDFQGYENELKDFLAKEPINEEKIKKIFEDFQIR